LTANLNDLPDFRHGTIDQKAMLLTNIAIQPRNIGLAISFALWLDRQTILDFPFEGITDHSQALPWYPTFEAACAIPCSRLLRVLRNGHTWACRRTI